MRRAFLVALVIAGICCSAYARELNVLCLGNSFTRNATKFLPQIVQSVPDCKLNLAIVYYGGSTLQFHWNRVEEAETNSKAIYFTLRDGTNSIPCKTLKDLLAAKKWDVIVPLHQYGQKPRFSEQECEPYATKLYNYVKSNAPNAQIMIHQTWAYRPDVLPVLDAKNKNAPLYYDGYQGMYDTITARYVEMAKKFNIQMIPSGAAMKLCQDRHPLVIDPTFDYKKRYYDAPLAAADMPKEKWSMHVGPAFQKQADGRYMFYIDFEHASPRAEYMLSCLWFETLFNKDCRRISFKPDFLTADEAEEFRILAHETATKFIQPAPAAEPSVVCTL